MKAWTSQLIQDLDSSRLRNSALEQQLQACKDDLFRMQPRSEVPDSAIAQAYGDLYEYIASWVEGEISRFEASCRKTHHGSLPELFYHGGLPEVEAVLSAHPKSGGEYMRSETLCALSADEEVQQSRRKSMERLTECIMNQVADFFPIVKGNQKSLRLLFDKVITPATKLADMIRTSPTAYELIPKEYGMSFPNDYVFVQDELSDYKLVDVASGKTLKPNSPVQPNEEGEIGTAVMVLAPALYRCDPGQDELLLVKAVILIELFKPLGRRRAATGPSGSGPEKFSGVVV
ncbi:MAG: hypothetical protein Q9225_003231 [Loekoesia sp. 1 TL-2023]